MAVEEKALVVKTCDKWIPTSVVTLIDGVGVQYQWELFLLLLITLVSTLWDRRD